MSPPNKLTTDQLGRLIYEIRGQRVMLDSDLATIYGVPTGALNRAIKRNRERFPKDFMFQISSREWQNLKYQIGTSSSAVDAQLINELKATGFHRGLLVNFGNASLEYRRLVFGPSENLRKSVSSVEDIYL